MRWLSRAIFSDIAQANVRGLQDKAQFQVMSGRIYITLGCFLLGLCAGRKRFFHQLAQNQLFFKKIFKYSGFAMLSMIAIAIGLFAIVGSNSQGPPPPPWMFVGMVLYYSSSVVITFFYVAGATLLFQRASWQGSVRALSPVGRMGLTNYVLQSVIGTLIFYGYGLNLLGEIPLYVAAALTLPIFALQIVFSRWWLGRFQYGPWNGHGVPFTYLRLQPLRNTQGTAIVGQEG